VVSVIFVGSVYVRYCFCNRNTVSQVRFTGKKLKFQIFEGESIDPFSPPLNDALGLNFDSFELEWHTSFYSCAGETDTPCDARIHDLEV